MSSGCTWRGFATDAPRGLFVAWCSCGWRSRAYATAGRAGAAVDAHLRVSGEPEGPDAEI